MEADSLEARLVSRGVAAMAALSVGVLLSTVRVSPLDEPGASDAVSVELVRTKEIDMAMARAAIEKDAKPAQAADIVAEGMSGEGTDTRLWELGAHGELVFRNRDRFYRCITARRNGQDEADCPSANDARRMVLASGVRA